MTDEVKEVQEVKEDAKPAKEEITAEVYKVVVTNTKDGETAELLARECAYERKDSFMKGIRQKIRDMGLTVRNATVTDEITPDVFTKTIAFEDAVIQEKAKPTGTGRSTSTARKQAEDQTHTEKDAEILGIALDADVPEEDAREALMKYQRHELIHAANLDVDEAKRITHYSTKAQAVEALLAKAHVEAPLTKAQ